MTEQPPRFEIAGSELAPEGGDELSEFSDYELPSYLGSWSFNKLPWITDDDEIAQIRPDVAIVGAPVDEGASNRPGARFGPRAIRQATYHSGDLWSIQLHTSLFDKISAVDAGDAPVVASSIERGLRVVIDKGKGGPAIYGAEELDITTQVIEEFNKEYP